MFAILRHSPKVNFNYPITKLCLAVLMGAWVSANRTSLQAEESSQQTLEAVQAYEKHIYPLLEKYCHDCHGEDVQKNDLRMDTLDPNMVKGKDGAVWRSILDALDRGDMPPKKKAQPTEKEHGMLTTWLSGELKRAAQIRQSTSGHVTLRRLTNYEYQNTMRDLLGIDLDYTEDLPPDTIGRDGFKNNGVFLEMSAQQLKAYNEAAKKGLSAAIFQGDPIKPVHDKITKSVTKIRFDRMKPAQYVEAFGATPVGKSHTMVLVCMETLPLRGTFRVRVKASMLPGDPEYSPPRMQVHIGHKTGALVEPKRLLAEEDVTALSSEPQDFVFTGRLEDFPLHNTDPGSKKFPGLRLMVTDQHSAIPTVSKSKKGKKKPKKDEEVKKVETLEELYKKHKRPVLLVHSLEFESPIDKTWPPESHTRLLPPKASDQSDEVYLQSVIENFISRAYRRPAEKAEVTWAVNYFERVRPTMETFEDAIIEVFALILTSAKFLYLPEYQVGEGEGKNVPLTQHELANRLSYFLWGTMPDQELQDLAQQGKLANNGTLEKQVARMLADDRSWEFVEGFAGQWLMLDKMDGVAINPDVFKKFDLTLKEDMRKESLAYFAEILYKRESCLKFIDSDFVMVNDRMAEFYGLEKPKSGEFQRVSIPATSPRSGGVLTQASFLLGNSTGAKSHPIKRATWFVDRIIGTPAPDPPADVPEIEEDTPEAKNLTLKQQIEAHTQKASCYRCHRHLDPWGIPFEEYNAIGEFIGYPADGTKLTGARDFIAKKVENDTALPDGTEVKGTKELVKYLLENKKDQFAEAFSKHLLTYALGRSIEWTDQPLLDKLAKEFKEGGYRMDQLIVKVVQTDAFKTK